jgi:hypothetical protein
MRSSKADCRIQLGTPEMGGKNRLKLYVGMIKGQTGIGGISRRSSPTENRLNGSSDNQFFICADDANTHWCSIDRNDIRISLIAGIVKADPEELKPLANARTHGRGVLSDPGAKNQQVKPAKCRGESADPLLCLITKNINRVGRARITLLALEQVAHVR